MKDRDWLAGRRWQQQQRQDRPAPVAVGIAAVVVAAAAAGRWNWRRPDGLGLHVASSVAAADYFLES